MRKSLAVVVLSWPLVSGCAAENTGGTVPPSNPAPAVQAPATDQWLGQWTGPEGTFLRITGGQGQYEVTVQTLDGPRTFKATAAGGGIQFQRDGVAEVIRATDGAGTGMKWLRDKTDCLTVRPGEGYCRN